MATIPNSQNFPQFSQADIISETKKVSNIDISDFRFYPAIQNRPNEIIKIESEENGIVLTFGTVARKALLSYTHETSLHLYKPADATVDTLYLHINIWTDDIFRVVFSKEKKISNPFSGLPENARMLIAKPEKVEFTLDETENKITLTTSKTEITVDKKTTRISAKFIDGKEF